MIDQNRRIARTPRLRAEIEIERRLHRSGTTRFEPHRAAIADPGSAINLTWVKKLKVARTRRGLAIARRKIPHELGRRWLRRIRNCRRGVDRHTHLARRRAAATRRE